MVTDRAGLPPSEFAELSAALAAQRSLAAVARWCGASGHAIHDVITQDEYTHDVIVRLTAGRYLVYDTT